jgi:hypothetical protein
MTVWSTDARAEEALRFRVVRGEGFAEFGSRLTGESLDTPNFCILPCATAHDLRRPEVLVLWTECWTLLADRSCWGSAGHELT